MQGLSWGVNAILAQAVDLTRPLKFGGTVILTTSEEITFFGLDAVVSTSATNYSASLSLRIGWQRMMPKASTQIELHCTPRPQSCTLYFGGEGFHGSAAVRFVVNAGGSRGDLVPFVALSQRLRDLGHTVLVALPDVYEAHIRNAGLDFARVGSPYSRSEIVTLAKAMMGESSPGRQWVKSIELTAHRVPQMLSDLLLLCKNADCFIGHFFHGLPHMVQDVLALPIVTLRMSHFAEDDDEVREGAARIINRIRSVVGLNMVRDPYGTDGHSSLLSLYTSSPYLTDDPQAVGFFYPINAPSTFPHSLQQFLEKGPPPILVSFGSMIYPDPKSLLEILLGAIRQSGSRAIIQAGSWLPHSVYDIHSSDSIHFAGPVSHVGLLPRTPVVIHHGGGVITECLRQGVPSISIPCVCDNFLWAKLLVQKGLSPQAIPLANLSTAGLASALGEILINYSQYSNNCKAAALHVRNEPGAAEAAQLIVTTLQRRAT